MTEALWKELRADRRRFIGGSDARIIMGEDEAALVRLWREKRGEVEPEDLSGNLIGPARGSHRGPEPAFRIQIVQTQRVARSAANASC
jgi:hypothetical protein